jgi:hypothetical protein
MHCIHEASNDPVNVDKEQVAHYLPYYRAQVQITTAATTLSYTKRDRALRKKIGLYFTARLHICSEQVH